MLRIGEGLSRNLGPGTRMPFMFANWASMRMRLSSKQQLKHLKAKLTHERHEAKALQDELRKAKEHEQLALARLEKAPHRPLTLALTLTPTLTLALTLALTFQLLILALTHQLLTSTLTLTLILTTLSLT